jgi:hypothetical protein
MQWNAIVGFIDMFYLVGCEGKIRPGKAWKLVARCVAAIFK